MPESRATPPPEIYRSMIEAGIPVAIAYEWAEAYEPDVAVKWWRAGVTSPGAASEWQMFGFTPATAAPWTSLEQGPADAAALAEAGVTAIQHGRSLGRETAGYVPIQQTPPPGNSIAF